jgi:2-oxoacid:acceptor oxidoreductase gamma subunit (pyruvate/2-ketoisovalerate family)
VEVRLHGRGGQGVVKAAEIVVKAAVLAGRYGVSIPFFGFERQGAPVTAFVRLADRPIRPKTRVYTPDCLVVMDQLLLEIPDIFEGLVEGGIVIVNTPLSPDKLDLPAHVGKVGTIYAATIALETLGRNIPNTVMLGAFCAITEGIDLEQLKRCASEAFGEKNALAVQQGFDQVCNTVSLSWS